MTDVMTGKRRDGGMRSDLSAADKLKPNGPALVSAKQFALHCGIASQHVTQLLHQGVLERRSDGRYNQDLNRLRYFNHLRAKNNRSPLAVADAEHASAKAELVRIRIAQARRELVKRTDVNELLDSIAAITLTHLSGMSARCAPPGDVVTRRNIDAVVYQIRREISLAASAMADERGEPPLSEQG